MALGLMVWKNLSNPMLKHSLNAQITPVLPKIN